MGKYMKLSQIFDIVKMHFYVSAVSVFMGTILPFVLDGSLKYIFSGVFILIYALALYSKSGEAAAHDKKEYTPEKAYAWKGLLLPCGIFAVWVVLFALYSFSWKYDIVGYSSGFINNLLFAVWNFIYSGFLDMNNGSFNWYAVVIAAVVPVAACGIGYYAGFRRFDLSEKVAKIVYEQKDEEKN